MGSKVYAVLKTLDGQQALLRLVGGNLRVSMVIDRRDVLTVFELAPDDVRKLSDALNRLSVDLMGQEEER